MSNPLLIKSKTAEGTIAAYRIVAHGTSSGEVKQATAATDKLCGSTGQLGVDAANERVDIVQAGRSLVEFGGTVAHGDPITSDALGRAVVAAPGAGSTVRIIGYAEQSSVSGDIADYLIAPSQFTG